MTRGRGPPELMRQEVETSETEGTLDNTVTMKW